MILLRKYNIILLNKNQLKFWVKLFCTKYCGVFLIKPQFGTAMKILHTSDLHIGKKLETKVRIDEQRLVLDEIVDICERENVQVVLIAGDVYDTFMPSAEAERLFFDTASKLSGGKRIVIIVSGNHDDSVRLNASNLLSINSDVYFSDSKNEDFNKEYLTSGVKMQEVGEGYFVVSDKKETVYIGALSYPTELRLKEKINDDESYSDKVQRWINNCFKNNVDNYPQIFVSHLFMLGGVKTEGERSIELGGARIIDKSLIPENCIYTALGHLHKRQIVDSKRNIIYSGSILQYSFDETNIEKSVTVFEVESGIVQNLKVVNLEKGTKLFRILATSLEDAEEKLTALDGFVELTLEIDKPLDSLKHKEFCKKFPNVFLKLRFLGEQEYLKSRRDLSDRDLFVEFYKSKYGTEPEDELIGLFLTLVDKVELEDETD